LSARAGANGEPGQISLCTRTSACTDICPLACTTDKAAVGAVLPGLPLRPRCGAPSGYARSTLSGEAHSDARPREHVDQGVDTEAMEAPPHEIVHAGLAYPQ